MLGDIFHSTYNPEWEHFVQFIRQRNACSFELVPGNHDILDIADYQRAGIKVLPLAHVEEPFVFSHEKIDDLPDQLYCFAGHEHPAIRLIGRGRQKLTLPCFFLWQQVCIDAGIRRFYRRIAHTASKKRSCICHRR